MALTDHLKQPARLAVAFLAFAVMPGTARAELSRTSTAGFEVDVDLSERKLYVREAGKVIQSYSVAVGQSGNPSPKGRFRIRHIVWNPKWVPPDAAWARDKKPRPPGDPKNPMGRVKLFFQEPDYYIHGTREVDSLGQAESRGCIRMRNADVIALAKTVMRYGGAPRPPTWFQSVLNRVRSSREVYLSRPVPITIRA